MGMFDSVYAGCAHCGKPLEFQSKEGPCMCDSYTTETAPDDILRDVLNYPQYCRHCGHWSVLFDPAFPPGQVLPRPTPVMRAVRDPLPGEVTVHSSQDFLRWWGAPFVVSDIVDAPAA